MSNLNIDFAPENKSKNEWKIGDINNVEMFYTITEGNPGSTKILFEIYKLYHDEEIIMFVNKLLNKRITGARLWYIYKNECCFSIQQLISKDLTQYTDEYFYDKFERYI